MFVKFIILLLVWIGLTNSIDLQELLVGSIISLIVVLFFSIDSSFNIKNLIIKYIKFIPIFLKNLILSNIEVMKIVLSPTLKTNTGIVKLKTSLKSDYDKLMLANAITLTPGTLTVELRDDELFIHILNIENTNREYLEKKIIKEFERGLK
jgi:multicomponent Na+:H+ antiporter subunit E